MSEPTSAPNPLLAAALQRCEGYAELKMWEAAWEELEALTTELKQDLAVLVWRMEILLGLGEHVKASFIGETLVKQYPNRLEGWLLSALCLFELPDHQSTLALLKNALVWHPKEPRLWMLLARTEGRLGNVEEAKDCVHQFPSLHPEGRVALLDLPELAFLWE